MRPAWTSWSRTSEPGGSTLIDDGRTLVVAETFAQRLTAFDVDVEGRLGERRLYADMRAVVGENALPDGLWGAGDSVWVATLEARQVVKIHKGEITAAVPVDGLPIACCTDAFGNLHVTVADARGRPVFEALAQKAVSVEVWVEDAAASAS